MECKVPLGSAETPQCVSTEVSLPERFTCAGVERRRRERGWIEPLSTRAWWFKNGDALCPKEVKRLGRDNVGAQSCARVKQAAIQKGGRIEVNTRRPGCK